MSEETPKVIYLIPEGGEYVWCDTPTPTDKHDANMAIRYQRNDGWISVKDRLPDEDGHYLTAVTVGSMTTERISYVNRFYKGQFNRMDWHKVTHWMPLPKPPKEEV